MVPYARTTQSLAPLLSACGPAPRAGRAMMHASGGDGARDADAERAAATHAALLSALERMTAQEEATAAARRAALTAAAYETEAEGSSPSAGGLASPWQMLSRDASADDLLADVAGCEALQELQLVNVAPSQELLSALARMPQLEVLSTDW